MSVDVILANVQALHNQTRVQLQLVGHNVGGVCVCVCVSICFWVSMSMPLCVIVCGRNIG